MRSFDNKAQVRVHHQICCAAAVNVLAENTASESPVDAGDGGIPSAPVSVSNAVRPSYCFVAFKARL